MSKIESQVLDVNDVCRITEKTIIKGEISSKSDIRVDGKIDGILYSDNRIVVGEKAELTGDIVCSNLDFWGKIKGNVYVKNELSLKNTACIEGDLNICSLNVELGAKLIGTCKMISEPQYEEFKKKIVTTNISDPKPAGAPVPAPAESKK